MRGAGPELRGCFIWVRDLGCSPVLWRSVRSDVASEKEFRKKIQQLGTLVGELNEPESSSKIAAREIVQLLMEVHGAGLERIMELVFESGDHGEAIINRLAQDPIARNLLLLYSLHPDDLETRILKALDDAKTRLRKHNGNV